MASVKAEAGGYRASNSDTTFSLALPSGLAAGDPLLMLLAGISNTLALSPLPTDWTLVSSGNFGTASYVLIRRTGGWQTADGTSLSVTVSAAMSLTWSAFGLDGTLYSPDTMTLGTVVTRGSSHADSVSDAAGTGASDTLVLSAEKATSHTGAPDAPSVSPATTLGGWEATATASTPSAYVGIYGGSPANRTITYTTASSNGAAFQLALAPIGPAVASGSTSIVPQLAAAGVIQ